MRAAYNESGKADFDVEVRFDVDDAEVATVNYQWAVRRPRG